MATDIVLVQFRKDQEIARHELECVSRDLSVDKKQITVYNAIKQDLSSIDPRDHHAFIFGGSGEISVSSNSETIESIRKNIKVLLSKIIKHDIPSLFICLGYHLLSDYLGEVVSRIPEQAESGTTKIFLTKDAINDPIFAGVNSQLIVQEAHNDSILNLPGSAILLAENQKCPIQAFRLKKHIYSMQFHPELQREDMLFRLNYYSDKYDTNKSQFQESKETVKILRNFKEIINKRN